MRGVCVQGEGLRGVALPGLALTVYCDGDSERHCLIAGGCVHTAIVPCLETTDVGESQSGAKLCGCWVAIGVKPVHSHHQWWRVVGARTVNIERVPFPH